MTIYRLSIEAIHGEDDGRIVELRRRVSEIGGIVHYDENATEGWGKAFTPGAFHLDWNSEEPIDEGFAQALLRVDECIIFGAPEGEAS